MKGDIETRLAQLRKSVEEARNVPMSASVMINRTEFTDLINLLEDAINATLSDASAVMGDREAVVASGQTEADELLRAAQAERDSLVSDTDVFRLAQARAGEIVAAAEKEAAELRAETDEYVEAKLANFEHTLDKTLDLVRKGRATLSGGHSHGLADDSDVAGMTLPDHLER
jgi:cell division septum initiation protein DivIVA